MRHVSDHIKSIIAVLVVVGSFAYFFVTYFIGKAQSDPQIIIAIVGAMTTVLAYYYGNSQGGAKKDEVINSMASNSNQNSTVNNADTVLVNNPKP